MKVSGQHHHDDCGREEAGRVDAERDDHRKAEEQPSERGTDEFVGQYLGGGQTRASPNQVVWLDGGGYQRDARAVDDGFGRCQQRGDDVDRHDGQLVDRNDVNERGHNRASHEVEADLQHPAVVTVGPRATRKDENEPRNPLGDRDAGNRARVGGHGGGEQWQSRNPQTVTDI